MPVEVVLKTLFIILVVVGALAPVITWVERKQSALMQDRIGANRAGLGGGTPLGVPHPAAGVPAWCSNNHWSLLGGMRAAAQMISYEVTMGLSVVGVFMVFHTLKLTDMALAPDTTLRVFGFRDALFGVSVPAA